MRSLTVATLQGAALPPDTARVTELIVFGPVILGGAAIAFFGGRLLAGAGLGRRAAVVTAVLAAVRGGRDLALGYAALTTALALGAAVAWRRVHPALGAALAAAACVAVVLPAEVPSRLSRVEYGQDPVLYV
jgi:hypothetical protein